MTTNNKLSIDEYRNLAYKIPKAEIHCHIEGTMTPDLLLKLSKKHNIKNIQSKTKEEIVDMFKFKNLKELCDIYHDMMQVLKDSEDYEDLMFEYLKVFNLIV